MNQAGAGVDVHRDELHARLLLEDGTRASRRAPNTAEGIRALLAGLPPGAWVGMEASGGLECFVAEECLKLGLEPRVMNPRQVRRLAQAMARTAKTDRLDADTILRALACVPSSAPCRAEHREFRELSRLMRAAVLDGARWKRRARAPGSSDTARALALKQGARLADSAAEFKAAALELARRTPAIALRLKLLQSIPGIGLKTAIALSAELPEDLSGWSRRTVASLAGLAPMNDDSGLRTGKARLPRQASRRLKACLHMSSIVAMRSTPWGRETAARMKAAGKHGLTIAVAIARRLLTQALAVLKRGTPFIREQDMNP